MRTTNISTSLNNVFTWRSLATWRLGERCLHAKRSSACCPTGFTLLELVLAMAVLATIAAIAWPHLQPGVSRAEYRSAALQLKSDFAEAREEAIHDGRVRELRFHPGTGRYVIVSANHDPAEMMAKQPERQPERHRGGNDSSLKRSRDAGDIFRKLPGEIVFRPPVTEFDARRSATPTVSLLRKPSRLPDDSQPKPRTENKIERLEDVFDPDHPEWVLGFRFFPDGRATEGTIDLEGPDLSREISVHVRGLTGGVTIGPVMAVDLEPGDDPRTDIKPQSAASTNRRP